jgi:16S rRNA (uracil1498-N3)-methyltransferase
MHRFLVHFWLSQQVILAGNTPIYHQLVRVFRSRIGDEFILFESNWLDYIYKITNITSNGLVCQRWAVVENPHSRDNNHYVLFQAYPNKINTLEIEIQKIVELWVQKIVLFPSHRSQMRFLSLQKLHRLELIASEALEQSWWNIPLKIEQYESIDAILWDYQNFYHIVGYPESQSYDPWDEISKKIGLWISPEWGWSPEEKQLFQHSDFAFWSFSQKILRLETAAIVGSGIILYSHYIKKA